jgi:lipopolysaccharide biosynthesis protein
VIALKAARRPNVIDEVMGHVVCEQGSLAGFGEPDGVAVAVHWASSPVVSRSFRQLVRDLSSAGYRTVVVSACEAAEPLDWSGALAPETIVLRKPNFGYDFGSWAVALALLPAILRAPRVLLANDSVVGPFTDLDGVVADFESSTADVWALTDTRQFFHHLQSYFMGFKNGVLADPPLTRFWSGVRQERSKWEIIRHNELALSRLLYREGYVMQAAFRADDVVRPGENPVIRGWRSLLAMGFPFVKREIVRDPKVAPGGEFVAREVRSLFRTDLEDWV